MINVTSIQPWEAAPWILDKHYAHRLCPISFAFGAYRDGKLIGIVTYGTPISSTLRTGVCGEEWEHEVIELNRLVCENTKNIASTLVGRSLQLLPKPAVVVSYADTEQGHVGYVYQATNFMYTGLSKPMSDPMVEGMEHMHHTALSDVGRGHDNRAEFLRQQYGDKLYMKPRARKHRYIYLCGDKREKKALQNALCYDIIPYPKGSTTHYDTGAEVATQRLLL